MLKTIVERVNDVRHEHTKQILAGFETTTETGSILTDEAKKLALPVELTEAFVEAALKTIGGGNFLSNQQMR